MIRFLTYSLLLILISGLSNCSQGNHEPLSGQAEKPNIIFIIADDLGYADLGCYGQKEMQSPNIDQMAAEGIRFTQAYCGSPVCAPSRSVLMTGLHSGHTTIRANTTAEAKRVPLRDEDVTFAEILKEAGYATGIFGKWGMARPHTTGIPLRQGFDEHFGKLASQRFKGSKKKGPQPYWLNGEIVPLEPDSYDQDLFMEKALDFIRRNRERRFLLFLPFQLPHAHSGERVNKSRIPHDSLYAAKDWPEDMKHYATLVRRMDGDVGRVLELLNEFGIAEKTIIFFTSDNGPHKEDGNDPEFFNSNGPFRGIKRDLYEGGIRVPMIVRWPGKIRSGSISDHIWAFWDVLPTLADLAGVEPPKDIDGISVLPALLGQPAKSHQYLYWEFHQGGFRQALRMGDWKAHRFTEEGLPTELYNLKNDPGEQKNVAAQHPGIIQKVEAIFLKEHTPSKEFPAPIDDM